MRYATSLCNNNNEFLMVTFYEDNEIIFKYTQIFTKQLLGIYEVLSN